MTAVVVQIDLDGKSEVATEVVDHFHPQASLSVSYTVVVRSRHDDRPTLAGVDFDDTFE